jgi:hypothetical protein
MPDIVQTVELKKVLNFLNKIGIQVVEKELDDTAFLPGLALGPNCIYIDFSKLLYPGDILHEAGHLAVATSETRSQIGSESLQNWPTDGEEIAAILWSFAALTYLELPSDFVFHSNGYKNGAKWLIESFSNKNYVGLPLLEWMGLTLSDENARLQNQKPFPHMQKWMRD